MSKAKSNPITDTWAELYNLESHKIPVKQRVKVGRPARPIKRTRVTVELTDEELMTLVQIQNALKINLSKAGALTTVSRGQVTGLGLRLLKTYLLTATPTPGEVRLPEHITDWKGLADLLKKV